MRSIRNIRAATAALFHSHLHLSRTTARHPVITRAAIAGLALAIVFSLSRQGVSQAGLTPIRTAPPSILPQNVGIALATNRPVLLRFDAPMDRASVEAATTVLPEVPVNFQWSADQRSVLLMARRHWLADERYVVVVGGQASRSDGSRLEAPLRFSFTTQTAPVIDSFRVRLANADADPGRRPRALLRVPEGGPTKAEAAPPRSTSADVSAATQVAIGFSAAMDQADVERNLTVAPAIRGTVVWRGTTLVFAPTERLRPNVRYTIGVAGAHDALGNPVGGDDTFSFTTRARAQVVKATPAVNAANVTSGRVELWFSQSMDAKATGRAFRLIDLTSGATVPGTMRWAAEASQLRYQPAALALGHRYEVRLGSGASDADGNPIILAYRFSTANPAVSVPSAASAAPASGAVPAARPRPAPVPAPAASGSLLQYALNQINASRAAYGFAPVVLDPAVTAVASAHAWDQLRNGYFSHVSPNGMTYRDRLLAGGVRFSAAGENQCYYVGIGPTATLSWCHAQFMAEPYPGLFNHIANVLDGRFRRVGVGIATDGQRVIITWDYVN
ncbi:MAG: Ig-like domain-containing protein [Chloroflexota bacterium]|nr:Ig-like domain-containing protein [Chloroflexota bacterium]